MLVMRDGSSEIVPAVEGGADRLDAGSTDSGAVDDDVAETGVGSDDRINHLLTHKPVDVDHCETCMRAKTRSLRKLSGRSTRSPDKFGDLITMYHMGMQDAWQ